MKKWPLILLFIAICLARVDVSAREAAILHYDVFFQGVPAGSAKLEQQYVSDDTLYASFILNTKGLINRLFMIRDTIFVVIDTKDYTTIRWEKRIHEGKYHRLKTFNRDQDTLLPRKIRDEYSALMMLMDEKHFRRHELNIVLPLKENVEEITLSLINQEYIDGDRSFYWTNVYEPDAGSVAHIKNGENRMWIWMKDSVPSFPVRLRLQFKYGNVILKVNE